MWKPIWPIGVVVLCLHCAGATKSASPEQAPTEQSEEATSAQSAGEPAASSEGAASAEPSASGASAKDKAPGGKKKCAELKKNDCKVTQGCAWNDVHKCVDE